MLDDFYQGRPGLRRTRSQLPQALHSVRTLIACCPLVSRCRGAQLDQASQKVLGACQVCKKDVLSEGTDSNDHEDCLFAAITVLGVGIVHEACFKCSQCSKSISQKEGGCMATFTDDLFLRCSQDGQGGVPCMR